MTDLGGKEKRYLRRLAQQMKPAVIIGRAGLSGPLIEKVGQLLDRLELIKVSLGPGAPLDRADAAEKLATATAAACAGILGRTFLLYRPNEKLDPRKRLKLPTRRSSPGQAL